MISMEKIGILNESQLLQLGLSRFITSLNPHISEIPTLTSPAPLMLGECGTELEVLICDLISTAETEQIRADMLIKICHLYPRLRLIVYSYSTTTELLQELERFPQITLISRFEPLAVTKECFLRALDGFKVCSPLLQAKINKCRDIPLKLTSSLTRNEIKVLENLFRGISISEMSYQSKCNVKTLSGYKRSAMRKLGVFNNAELYSIQDHVRVISGA